MFKNGFRMRIFSSPAQQVMRHPAAFAIQTLSDFSKNQGLLLAGAIAYYALLSLVPLMILAVIAFSNFVDQAELLATLARYLEWLVPSQSKSLIGDVSSFLDDRFAIGAVLLITMLFFSSLTFSALEKAMHVIFAHRKERTKRHPLVSAIIPYCFVMLLALVFLAVTLISTSLQAVAQESVHLLGRDWALGGMAGLLLYLLGLSMETLLLALIYLVMPVGRTRLTHAFIGAMAATGIWEALRHLLIWYFTTLSKASVVYGSLTTAVVALFSMEIAATLLLIGAQVISEYEQLGRR